MNHEFDGYGRAVEVFFFENKVSRTAKSPATLLHGYVENPHFESATSNPAHTEVVRVPREYSLPKRPDYDMHILPGIQLFTREEVTALAERLPVSEDVARSVDDLLQNPQTLISLMRAEIEVRRSQVARPAA